MYKTSQMTTSPDTLCIIVPIYNEARWLPEVFHRLAEAPFLGLKTHIVLVDDASTDNSVAIIEALLLTISCFGTAPRTWQLIKHPVNQGKGKALQTGIAACNSAFIIIHDADLEYDPCDYDRLLNELVNHNAPVVFGSRLHPHVLPVNREGFSSVFYLGNRLLTWVTNMLYATRITDMETCYKAFRADILHRLPLKAKGFDIEPEITALLARRHIPIVEVPITYKGRKGSDGKKIGWRDGYTALKTLVKYKIN